MLWFRLALKMGRTVDELQRSMTSAEFGEWIAFYSIEPFGDHIADIRAGTIAASVINPQLKKDSTPYKPLDFFQWADPPEQPSVAPPPEAVAAGVFGVNLAELKASGKKKLILRRKP
ncbi:phage tail assembly protein T [Pararobbsia alpina]|uniref:Minor tail T domain-containing protein n=1 Tax=Pararobbsia alpina TaxID=621374 RepID=A0A6S7BPU2_9BURK|nr:hypothetical protein [Pararobbsia alpina]CAB3795493.1 hypothetical protein LMG28138_03891 [Pararobbsia alpina]